MNKTGNLHERLGILVEDSRPRVPIERLCEHLGEALRAGEGTAKLPLIDSLALDLALFWHKYFLATLCAAAMAAALGLWIGLSTFAPGTMHTVLAPPMSMANNSFHAGVAAVPSHAASSAAIDAAVESNNKSYTTCVTHSPDSTLLPQEEQPFAALAPRMLSVVSKSEHFVPVGVGVQSMRFPDPPLDFSGVTASVTYEQPGIPANSEFTTTRENNLNYEAGYRFDRFEEVGIGYSQHVYRQISSTTATYKIVNLGTGQITYTNQTTWSYQENVTSLTGIYYTFHAANLQLFDVEPFVTAFASKPTAGFLWRASAGLEWNAWDNLNAIVTYSREQLNSAAYPAPENARNYFSFGFSYRVLP